jgi:hypothetical protein
MSRTAAKFFSLLVMLSIISIPMPATLAQTQNTGAIQGRVFEAVSIAPLPGATVTITHEDIGLERTTVTNEDGVYYVGILPAGRYRISATRQGYQNDANPENSIIRNFLIHITNTEKADQPPPITLQKIVAVATPPTTPPPTTPPPATQPAASQTSPAKESSAELLVNTSNATRGGNFGELPLLALPLPGVRTFDDLAFLVPGVFPAPQAIGSTIGPGIGPGVGTSGQFSVNGLRSRANNFTIDGSNNNDEEVGVRRQGFTALVPQSIESVQEFQISTLLPEPQFGRSMGAQVNAVSKSGGADYHGTLYGFFTDKRLKAHDPFDFEGGPASTTLVSGGQTVLRNGAPFTVANPVGGENPFTRAQYGFVFGGPVVKQKTHFFASFEHQDINASRESHFAVPTVAERGLFQTGDKGFSINGQDVFPTSLVGDSFFSLFPFPNNPIGPYGRNTFTEIIPADADGTIFSGKLDHNFKAFGHDHILTGRYNFTDDDTTLPVTGEAIFSSLRALVRTQDFALSLNSALSSRAANQFRFSFGRTSLGFKEVRDPLLIPSAQFPDTPFLLNAPLLTNVTLPGTAPQFIGIGLDTENAFGIDSGTGPLGQVKVSGFSPLGVDVFNFPQGRSNNIFQYADTFIYNLRKHRFTAGFDSRRSQLNSSVDRNFRPLAVFSAAADLSIVEKLSQTLSNLGSIPGFYLGKDFVAVGAPTGFYQTLAQNPDSTIGLRYWQHNFFLADQIHVRNNLSVTLGLRYELNTVPQEVHRRIESTFTSPEVQEFIDVENSLTVNGTTFGSGLDRYLAGRREIYEGDHNNFAPHVAFAWDPYGKGKTSIRAGYGIYYDQILGSVISQSRNVFPSFLPINLAGFDLNNDNPFSHPLRSFNPALLAVPGTLNTFDPTRNIAQGPRSAAVNLYLNTETRTNFATGPAFVLPAADLVTPYAQHWSLTLEQQIKDDLLLSVGYVGTRGSHLLRRSTPNLGLNATPVVNQVVADNGIPSFIGFTLPPNRNLNSLRPFPLLGSITLIESDSNSVFHSLQLQAVKRFSHGLQFTAAYAWSHAIDEVSDIFDLAGAQALPQNSLDRRAERASANFDVRHRFVYSFIWDIPAFRESRILGGWQLSSIGTFQTGQPYSVLFCCDSNLDGNLTDRIDAGLTSPGITGRNQFRAPGIENVDVAVNKAFRFNDRQKLEFRSEFFNVFNRTQFGIPVHQLFFGGFGITPATQQNFVETRLPKRTIQFALKYSF